MFVSQTLSTVSELANRYINVDYDYYIGKMILDAMTECKKGINSLAETYRDDRLYSKKFKTLIRVLEIEIGSLTANLNAASKLIVEFPELARPEEESD